jgi:K+ transporter
MLKKLLLMLVLFGTSMVIADGVVTPAMSGSYISDALLFVFLFTKFGDLHFVPVALRCQFFSY